MSDSTRHRYRELPLHDREPWQGPLAQRPYRHSWGSGSCQGRVGLVLAWVFSLSTVNGVGGRGLLHTPGCGARRFGAWASIRSAPVV